MVSGKKRTEISVDANLSKEDIIKEAKESAAKWLEGKSIIKEIFVPNKLVNFVAK